MKQTAIVLYMPALHKGCINFINKNGGIYTTVFLIEESLVKEIDSEKMWMFEKYLNAMTADEAKDALLGIRIASVKVLDKTNLLSFGEVIIPENDDLVEKVLSEFYPSITPKKVFGFIRWGRKTVLSQRAVIADAIVSINNLEKELMIEAFIIAEKSEDWWRQVGVILKPINTDPIYSYNHHLPHQYAPYINGDPRSDFKPGECIEYSTAIHAEAAAVAYAGRKGIALEGASIYVTTFPCPNCARLLVESGIKTVYYCEAYSLLDAADILRAAKVKLVFVDVSN